ncbi:MAG TPA: dihydrolipoamide acetyltransferase family protein [Amnibacterium sp.]|uniref:dihydrolipoamide acetyltransferase family protein n=1 Tax=Amnibacterium sp. TaxID=1872496 RepID=UPI002F94B865
MSSIIRMPEVLANTSEAAIQTWLVRTGETIAIGAPLAEVETEKAVVEYSAEVEGTVLELLVGEGQSVRVGDPIAVVGDPSEARSPDEAPAAPADEAQQPPQEQAPEQAVAPEPETAPEQVPSPVADTPAELPADDATRQPGGRLFASPIVRRLAKEHGLDLARLTGTGPSGRIVRRDVERALAAAPPAPAVPPAPAAAAPTPAVQAPTGTDFEDLPLSGMRRAIARRLTESKTTVPHFYVVGDCRMDALLEVRRRLNEVGTVKVSVNDLLIKAAAVALQQVPDANAIWTGDAIRRFRSVDIAVAVAVPNGLVTPVVRGVEGRSAGSIAETVRDLAERARAGRLKQQELEGGSFSISNLGMFGVREFSAIINPPQSAILAVGAAQQRPVVVDGALEVATMMTVTLSADHRVIDGALAAQWLAAFTAAVEQPFRLLV